MFLWWLINVFALCDIGRLHIMYDQLINYLVVQVSLSPLATVVWWSEVARSKPTQTFSRLTYVAVRKWVRGNGCTHVLLLDQRDVYGEIPSHQGAPRHSLHFILYFDLDGIISNVCFHNNLDGQPINTHTVAWVMTTCSTCGCDGVRCNYREWRSVAPWATVNQQDALMLICLIRIVLHHVLSWRWD